jgi:hypothetical protein
MRLVGPRAGLDWDGERKFLFDQGGGVDTQLFEPVRIRYNTNVTPAPVFSYLRL